VLVLSFRKIVRQNNGKGFACKLVNPFLLPDKLELLSFYCLLNHLSFFSPSHQPR